MAKATYMETSNSSPSQMGRGTVREANGGGEIHRSRPFPSTSLRLVPPSPRFAQGGFQRPPSTPNPSPMLTDPPHPTTCRTIMTVDRKNVVEGKDGLVRVNIGGGLTLTKKTTKTTITKIIRSNK